MAKPVKKDKHPIVLGTEPKKELEICIEQFEFLPLQERGSGFLSSHLSQLVELSEQIKKKKRDWEDQVKVFLQKNMVEKFPELFICQLSRFYPFSPELLQKHIQRLNDWHLEVNFHVWTNEITKKVLLEHKPDLIWAIEEWLCYVEDSIIFQKFFVYIKNKNYKSKRNKEPVRYIYENAVMLNNQSIFKEVWEYDISNYISKNKKILWTKERFDLFYASREGNLIYGYRNFSGNIAAKHLLLEDYILKRIDFLGSINLNSLNWQNAYYETKSNIEKQSGYIENDRYREWDEDFIKENFKEFDWYLFSGNPGLPYSVELLNTYAEYWDMEQLKSNKGVYDKALAPLLTDRIVDQLLKLCY